MSLRSQKSTSQPTVSWHPARLGDICEIVASQVDPTLAEYSGLPHVNGENIESGSCRLKNVRSAREDNVKSGKYLFEQGDVLYSKLRPYLRKVTVAPFRGLCSADMYPLRATPKLLDPQFLAWLLLTETFTTYADGQSRRSRMPKLNREQLFAWEALLPPLPEQRRIAACLREQLAEVEQARAAIRAQIEAAEHLHAAELRSAFTSSAVRNWPVKTLMDVSEICGGVTLGRDFRGRPTRRVPYLRVANVKDGWLDLSEIKEVEATEREISDCRLQFGDILLTEGGDPDKLGRGTYWQEQIPQCIHQNHIFRVRFDLALFDPAFLAFQFGSPYGKAYFLAHAKQTTGIACINRAILSKFPLLVPPLKDQRMHAAELQAQKKSADILLTALRNRLAALDHLPAALLRQAFSGKL